MYGKPVCKHSKCYRQCTDRQLWLRSLVMKHRCIQKKFNHSPWATSTPVTCNHIVSLFYVLSTKQYKNSILKPKKPSVTKAASALNINTRSREQMTGAEQKTTRLLLRQCSLSDRMTAGTVINTALSTGTQHV